MRKVAALAALLVVLVSLAPSVQAMACAAEGCNPACSELAQAEKASEGADTGADNCLQKHCVCAAGHCSHAGVALAEMSLATVYMAKAAKHSIKAEHPVFAPPHTLERPPRI